MGSCAAKIKGEENHGSSENTPGGQRSSGSKKPANSPQKSAIAGDARRRSSAGTTEKTNVRPIEQEGGAAANLQERPPVSLSNGVMYVGQWLGEKRHGRGRQVWSDGSRYEGNWERGMANGEGTFTRANGDRYIGQWKNDKANGYGELSMRNGSSYKGYWKNDEKHGTCVETWGDGSKFEGTYDEGYKKGSGVIQFADGSCFNGEFKNGDIDGMGVYTWSDGRQYSGAWERNAMNGEGIFTWPNGCVYSGQYVHDKKSGMGKFTWEDGRCYDGEWKAGKQHGKGKFSSKSGRERMGMWFEGTRVEWLAASAVDEEAVDDLSLGTPTGDATSVAQEDAAHKSSTLAAPDDSVLRVATNVSDRNSVDLAVVGLFADVNSKDFRQGEILDAPRASIGDMIQGEDVIGTVNEAAYRNSIENSQPNKDTESTA